MFFARPEMLWLMAVVMPLLSLFLVWAWRKRQRLMRQFVQSRLLAVLTVGVSPRRQKLRMILFAAAIALILLALARPLYGFTEEEFTRRGVDILVAIDTSRSMLARDVPPDRLTRAKLAALDLMELARGDRLGLIAFAGTAFLQCPLTIDWVAFQESVNALDTEIVPQQGTALARVVDTAIDALDDQSDNFRALVILSDGEDHEAGLEEAAQRARDAGLRIYAVGVGTPEGDRIPLRNERGETVYLKDDLGQTVVSKLNPDALRQLAQATGGEYIPLQGAEPMKLLYENRIALLPQVEYGARLGRLYFERFQWPLGLAILLLFAEMLLPCRRRVERPSMGGAPASAVGRLTALLLFALWAAPPAEASARRALRAYEQGDYPAAMEEFRKMIAEGESDPRVHYNAGVTAYRLHDFEEAANEFSAAILGEDKETRQPAYYNLGNALFRLGEQSPDPALRKERWEAALKAYEAALQLDPEDRDARHNRDVVKARLEELERQMQQQQQQQQQQSSSSDQQDQDQPKSQQNQSDQNQSDQNRQDQQNQQAGQDRNQPDQGDQQQQQQQQQSRDRSRSQDQQQSKDQQDASAQEQPSSPEQEQEQKPGSSREGSPESDRERQQAEAAAQARPAGPMTPEEARRLLEGARAEERLWFEAERRRQPATLPTRKPW